MKASKQFVSSPHPRASLLLSPQQCQIVSVCHFYVVLSLFPKVVVEKHSTASVHRFCSNYCSRIGQLFGSCTIHEESSVVALCIFCFCFLGASDWWGETAQHSVMSSLVRFDLTSLFWPLVGRDGPAHSGFLAHASTFLTGLRSCSVPQHLR